MVGRGSEDAPAARPQRGAADGRANGGSGGANGEHLVRWFVGCAATGRVCGARCGITKAQTRREAEKPQNQERCQVAKKCDVVDSQTRKKMRASFRSLYHYPIIIIIIIIDHYHYHYHSRDLFDTNAIVIEWSNANAQRYF